METFLKCLFGIGEIVLCLFIFVLIIGGGIYAVAYALGETQKYRNEVEKEELNEIDNVETEK